jgi:hypothetical protein
LVNHSKVIEKAHVKEVEKPQPKKQEMVHHVNEPGKAHPNE